MAKIANNFFNNLFHALPVYIYIKLGVFWGGGITSMIGLLPLPSSFEWSHSSLFSIKMKYMYDNFRDVSWWQYLGESTKKEKMARELDVIPRMNVVCSYHLFPWRSVDITAAPKYCQIARIPGVHLDFSLHNISPPLRIESVCNNLPI